MTCPIFITVMTGVLHKCHSTPFPNSSASKLDSEAGWPHLKVETAGILALSPTLRSWTKLGYPHLPLWGQVTS